jgi:ABC-type multidrug transport system fused ATPase/permease subunit
MSTPVSPAVNEVPAFAAAFQKKYQVNKPQAPPVVQQKTPLPKIPILPKVDDDVEDESDTDNEGMQEPSDYSANIETMFATASEPKHTLHQPNQASSASTPRKAIWDRDDMNSMIQNNRHLIRANGGATPRDSDHVPRTIMPPSSGSRPMPNNMPPFTHRPIPGGENDGTMVQSVSDYSRTAATRMSSIEHDSRPYAGANPAAVVVSEDPRYMDERRSYDYDVEEDDDEGVSLISRFTGLFSRLPSIPVPSLPFRRKYSDEYDMTMDIWDHDSNDSDRGKKKWNVLQIWKKGDETIVSASGKIESKKQNTLSPLLLDFMDRCGRDSELSLLSKSESKRCSKTGQSQALFDMSSILFLLLGVREFMKYSTLKLPHSLSDLGHSIPEFFAILSQTMNSWTPYLFVTAFLLVQTNSLISYSRLTPLSHTVGKLIKDETQYCALFLRIFTSSPPFCNIPRRAEQAARAEVALKAAASRLRSFAKAVMTLLILTKVSVVWPLTQNMALAIHELLILKNLRQWPPNLPNVFRDLVGIAVSLGADSWAIIQSELSRVTSHPWKVLYGLSIMFTMLSLQTLTNIEAKRKTSFTPVDQFDEDNEDVYYKLTSSVSNLGVSGASRLQLLPRNSLELVLERWRSSIPFVKESANSLSRPSAFRLFMSVAAAAGLSMIPIFILRTGNVADGSQVSSALRWDSLLEISSLMTVAFLLTAKALNRAIVATETRQKIVGFIHAATSACDERLVGSQLQQPNLQLQASISPTAGIVVKDLWASHTTRRSWAVRGANLSCRNGEVVALLGDDGAGKSRFLTTLAEAVLGPPKNSMTTNKVRGAVYFGGLESSKWSRSQLKSRAGVILNDIRSTSDFAQVSSGLTLEEILEPIDGLRLGQGPHATGSNEKASMLLALKMTGLYSTLLPKLPSKLLTGVTANEEDMKPSPLRPRYNILSPSEWSKVLLARVLAQVIFDNENSASANDRVESSLVGAYLLLDEATANMSEVEEARLIRDLQRAGAATIMSSNRWSIGRLVDRIAVVKEGAIVETGTHSELLSRGPQQSIYAAKWLAMTSSSHN